MNSSTARLFQVAVYGWLAFYLVALLLLGDAAWTNVPVSWFNEAVSPVAFAVHRSAMDLMEAYGTWITWLALLLALVQMRYVRWWTGLVVWALFKCIAAQTWLASNGGIHLMENLLLWAALISVPGQVSVASFWIARLQVLLAYVAATAHKLMGTSWWGGDALLRVARDAHFDLAWLAQWPAVCHVLSYLVPLWSGLFVLAVWWRPTRRAWLLAGVVFHLSTAVFMDLVPMGLAFIASYAIWCTEAEADRSMLVVRDAVRWCRERVVRGVVQRGSG